MKIGGNKMKIERLIAIVMMLLERDVISAQEFADLFKVTKRTILRDMDTLALANIPVYALRGSHGGYGLMPAYKFDKRLLSVTDLENILIALNGFQSLMLNDDIKATLEKIRSMIPHEITQKSVSISFQQWSGRTEIAEMMDALQHAIKSQYLVKFTYIDVDGSKIRQTVEPYQLQAKETRWYLQGYVLEKQAFLTYKISRITNVKQLSTKFTQRKYKPNRQLAKTYFPFPNIPIKVKIDATVRDQFVERYGAKVLSEIDNQHYYAEITVPYHEFGYRYLAGFGSHIKVIGPTDFVENYQRFLKQVLSEYDK